MVSNNPRVTAPGIDPPDFQWENHRAYRDWVINHMGGSHMIKKYGDLKGDTEEVQFKNANRRDGRVGLAAIDQDLIYANLPMRRFLLTSIKSGSEPRSEGFSLAVMLAIAKRIGSPLQEVRRVDCDVDVEESPVEGRWLYRP